MLAPNDFAGRTREIFELVAADSIDQGTKKVMDFVRDFSADRDHLIEVTLISADCSRLEKEVRQGLVNSEDAQMRRRKLLFQMLKLVSVIQESLGRQVAA